MRGIHQNQIQPPLQSSAMHESKQRSKLLVLVLGIEPNPHPLVLVLATELNQTPNPPFPASRGTKQQNTDSSAMHGIYQNQTPAFPALVGAKTTPTTTRASDQTTDTVIEDAQEIIQAQTRRRILLTLILNLQWLARN